MKIILLTLIASLALGYTTVNAQTFASFGPILANQITNLINGPIRVYSIAVANNAAAAANVTAIVDSPSSNGLSAVQMVMSAHPMLAYSNNAYISISQFVTNAVRVYTNWAGVTNNFVYTNTYLETVTNLVAANTNNLYRIPLVLAVPSAGSIGMTNTIRFDYGLTITNGLCTNTYVIYYSPLL
jgi:hypothetical protein